MYTKAAWAAIAGALAGAILLTSACGNDEDSGATGATPGSEPTATASAGAVSQESLQDMVPPAADLPGFVLSESRFVDNERASAKAPDPAARLASLNEMGRVIGFHAIFARSEGAPSDAPSAILWSVNLFERPSGALDFIRQRPEVSAGMTYEPLDVTSLGANAVGFAFEGSTPDGDTSAYGVAFAEGVIEVSVTTMYEGGEVSPQYTLNLAQKGRTLVEGALGSSPTPELSSAGSSSATPDSPMGTPAGIRVPTQAEVGVR